MNGAAKRGHNNGRLGEHDGGPGQEQEQEQEYANLSTLFTDVKTAMTAKKKKLHTFTSGSVATTKKKLTDLFDKHHEANKEYRNKFMNGIEMILKQFEADLVRIKENDEKLEKALAAHVKTSQQTITGLSQRLTGFKDLFAAYEKKCSKADKETKDLQVTLERDIAADMFTLEKQLLQESEKCRMANIRKMFLSD